MKTQGKHCIRNGPNHLFRFLLFLEMNLRELWSPVFFNRFMSAYSYENVFPLLLNQELGLEAVTSSHKVTGERKRQKETEIQHPPTTEIRRTNVNLGKFKKDGT